MRSSLGINISNSTDMVMTNMMQEITHSHVCGLSLTSIMSGTPIAKAWDILTIDIPTYLLSLSSSETFLALYASRTAIIRATALATTMRMAKISQVSPLARHNPTDSLRPFCWRSHFKGSVSVHARRRVTLRVNKTTNGTKTSFPSTVTFRNWRLWDIILLMRHILENMAQKEIVKPHAKSQIHDMQAILQPLSLAMLSSIPRGKVAEPMTKDPAHIVTRNPGCEERTTETSRFTITQQNQSMDVAMIMLPRVQEMIRTEP
mmetsp:Transcript_44190/g.134566  ORF Transcript_44190/g.134566 Transcript_44190/m.134566 type:complete len:261 (-) Transcript_44190:1321-2103(-)